MCVIDFSFCTEKSARVCLGVEKKRLDEREQKPGEKTGEVECGREIVGLWGRKKLSTIF